MMCESHAYVLRGDKEEKVLERDVEFIRYMEEINGLFEYETRVENLARPRGDSFYTSPIYYSEAGPKLDRTLSFAREQEFQRWRHAR